MENETKLTPETSNLQQGAVSGSAIVENEQVVLYFQFDDDEPREAIKCNGKEFTLKMPPVENNFVEFTDGNKRFRLSVRHCH
jgi:sucrose-6-phosphate hydrolase SacC (GH32 family)